MSLVEPNAELPENVVAIDGGYRSEVKYYAGKSTLSGKPAVLHWQNDTISLTQLSGDGGQASKVIFSVSPSQLKSVSHYGTVLGFRTEQGYFKVEFSYKAGIMIGAAGGMKTVGAAGAVAGRQTAGKSGQALLKSSGYYWWSDKLKAANVPFKQSKLITYILIGLFVIIVVILLIPK